MILSGQSYHEARDAEPINECTTQTRMSSGVRDHTEFTNLGYYQYYKRWKMQAE